MQNKVKSHSTSTIGYEIFIPIESPKDQDVISPLTIDGGIKDSGGVTARLYADYNWISSTGNLRINKVYGSWTPKLSIYRVSDRVVRAHNGGLFSKLKKLYRTL